MKKAGHLLLRIALVMGLLLCTACGDRREAQEVTSYKIYYVNNDETKIVDREYMSETSDGALLLAEFLEQLAHISEKMEYETLLEKEITVVGHTLDNGLLTLDFDESYHNLRGNAGNSCAGIYCEDADADSGCGADHLYGEWGAAYGRGGSGCGSDGGGHLY